MKLFHGTSDAALEQIIAQGLRQPNLTDSEEVAEYYAMTAVDELGGAPIVLEVEVPETSLKVDRPAFEEPLSFYRDEYTDDDNEWFEMLENGDIPSPANKDDWKTSLEVTRSVKCTETVKPENIMLEGQPITATAKASVATIKTVLANEAPEQIGADVGGQVTDYDLRVSKNNQPVGDQHPTFFSERTQKDK